jgi:hypothetical protein
MARSNATRAAAAFAAILLTGMTFGENVAVASPIAFVWDVQCDVAEPVCILVVPDGSGMAFADARTITGSVVDATISVQIWIIDEFGPVGPANQFDAGYVTIQAPDGLTRGCLQTHVAAADHNTDGDGWTAFSLAPRAGGWSQDLLEIYVVGDPASPMGSDIPPLPIYFNSPDINGDLQIDLVDVAQFTQDYFSGNHPLRSDFVWNGTIDLADVAVLAQYFGVGCR